MEQEEKPQQAPSLPVLPRLDRLDRLLELLEEKHSMSGRHLSNPVLKKTEQVEKEEEDPRKSLTSALEEVHHKGTLMDRLAMLESRVLQLSLEMDEGNTSRSSSSTAHVSKSSLGHDLVVSKGSRHDDDGAVVLTHHTKMHEPPPIQERPSDEECIATLTEERSSSSSSGKRKEKRKGYTKWMGWFRCGQERRWNDDLGPNTMELRSK